MEFFSEHIYLTGVIIYGGFWLLVLIKTKQWFEMLSIGLLFGVSAVLIGQFYALIDY